MNILLTSVGRRSYMIKYFKDVLKNEGLVHVANSEMTFAMSLADRYLITPNIYDESYVGFLIEYCTKNNITALVSLFDIDLPILAKHKEIFTKNGIVLIISDFNVTEMCNDKWLTYKFLLENKIPTPLTFLNLDSCKEALERKEICFPIIIKPRWGMGSIGIYEAENMEELTVLYKKTKRAIESTYLKFESKADLLNAVILQEKMNGDEYGIDVFNDLQQNYVCTIAKQKIAMRAGETDIAKIINQPELIELGKKLSSILKHIANLDVDIFLVDNTFHVLELNARFGGQYPFSHLAGANFPKMILNLLQNSPLDPQHWNVLYETVGFKDLMIKKMN